MTKFMSIVNRAKVCIESPSSSSDYEPILIELLNYIKSDKENKDEYIAFFCKAVDDESLPWEAIQFCMRELQWDEVKIRAQELIHSNDDFRVISVMRGILDVYEEEWEDSDFYNYYSCE